MWNPTITMKQAFLGADIDKGYIDITISDETRVINKLVYFDVEESFNSLLNEISFLFSKGIDVIHCGVVKATIVKNHWIYKLVNSKHNVVLHEIDSSEILKEYNKLSINNVTTLLICKYLKSHSGEKDFSFTEKKIVKTVEKFENYYTVNTLIKDCAITEEPISKKKSDLNCISNYSKLIKETELSLKKQLKETLLKTIPQSIAFCEKDVPEWLLKLLMKYPSQFKLLTARDSNVQKICKKQVNKAKSLISAIKTNNGFGNNGNLNYITKKLCEKILTFKKEEKNVVNFVRRSFKHPFLTKLKPIYAIDKFLTIYLIEEIGDVKRFKTVDEMTKYFGVHVDSKNEASSYQNKNCYSSYKSIINILSKKVIKTNPYFKQQYDLKIAKKCSHIEAIEFIEFKLTRVIYGLLKSEENSKDIVIPIEKVAISTEKFEYTTKVISELQQKTNEKARKMLLKKQVSKDIGMFSYNNN